MTKLNAEYWQSRWEAGQTAWDMGHASPALVEYMEQVADKSLRILIPGAGNAYEADWLWKQGFHNVHVLDWSAKAIENLSARLPEIPNDQLIIGDFFAHSGKYDLVLEQTFFCALDPSFRLRYAQHMPELLNPGGKLVGLFFDFEKHDGPPFGGSQAEYRALFFPYFEVRTMERAHNSIEPRAGSELFFILEKRPD